MTLNEKQFGPQRLWRGVRVGWAEDPGSLISQSEVGRVWDAHVRSDNAYGRSWTTSRQVADDFATGLHPIGLYNAEKHAEKYPGRAHLGFTIEADIETPDLGPAGFKGEDEVPVDPNALVNVREAVLLGYAPDADEVFEVGRFNPNERRRS